MTTRKVNVAKGKTVNNIVDFAKVFTGLSLNQKQLVLKNIKEASAQRFAPDGSKWTDRQKIEMAGLEAWCLVNIMIGDELCPWENVLSYVK